MEYLAILATINTIFLIVVIVKLSTIHKEMNQHMASQEERLQAIETKLQTVVAGVQTLKDQLAALKNNNPQIEDEISAIEGTVNDIGTALTPPTE